MTTAQLDTPTLEQAAEDEVQGYIIAVRLPDKLGAVGFPQAQPNTAAPQTIALGHQLGALIGLL